MGTIEGYCFCFSFRYKVEIKPCYKYISEHSIDGMALSQTCLWVSTCNQICFLNLETLDLEGVGKRTKKPHAFVGKIMISDDGDQMWSAHLGGIIMSVWNALNVCICLMWMWKPVLKKMSH